MERVRLAIITLTVAVASACGKASPEFEVGWVAAKLRAAGYAVSAPVPDLTAPKKGVVRADCLEATKAGKTDRLCVARCVDDDVCRTHWNELSPFGETFGEIHRGPTVLVHRQCGFRDCGAAREAITAP